MRTAGTVKWFNDAKGFGFITPEDVEGLLRPSLTGGRSWESLRSSSENSNGFGSWTPSGCSGGTGRVPQLASANLGTRCSRGTTCAITAIMPVEQRSRLRWRGWIGRWRSSRAYLRGGWLPNGTGSRYRRGSLRVGVHQPLASSCPGAVPGVRAQRPPPHSDRRRQSDGGLSGLPAPLGSVRRTRPPEFAVVSPGKRDATASGHRSRQVAAKLRQPAPTCSTGSSRDFYGSA